ncbi:MAG: hypothetical protein LWX09_04080, partial [Bacteroidia bacterium]|nr:hypothetical protein [Bacteroidia bacterium]
TENEMLQRINANSAFVCIKDSTLVSQLPSFGHHYIANADGIFKADSTYYRIFRQGIAAWRGASLNQMKNLTLNGDFDEDPADGKYFYLKDVTIEPTENNCGDYKRVEKNSEGGWYRVIFEIKLMRYGQFGNICKHTNQLILHYQYICNIILRGQVKRFWMWHSYKTSLEVQDVNFELLVPRQDNYDTLTCSYFPRFEIGGQINYAESKVNSPELSKIFKDATDGMGDVTHNYNLSHPVFIKVRGKGKSAALGIGNWATFSCGY